MNVHGVPALAVEHLTHPTFPESAGGTKAQKAANTKSMLAQWSGALGRLHPLITHKHKDVPGTPLIPYGDAFVDSDKVDIRPSTFRRGSHDGCTTTMAGRGESEPRCWRSGATSR